MDEHGLQELETQAGKVIDDSLTARVYRTSNHDTTWASNIECGTADDRRLPPIVTFTGGNLQGQWFLPKEELRRDLPGWKLKDSLTGWSNNKIAVKWFKEIYLPHTAPDLLGDYRILIVDEHGSHLSDKFLKLAVESKVRLVYSPSHTSHKTQPLERSVFAALKTYYRQEALLYAVLGNKRSGEGETSGFAMTADQLH